MTNLFRPIAIPSEDVKVRRSFTVLAPRDDRESAQPFNNPKDEIRKQIDRITGEIVKLKAERRALYTQLKCYPTPRGIKQYYLYALKLETGKYYVGFTNNVERRFRKHKNGKGAWWTKQYTPIEIVEVRNIDLKDVERSAYLEDDMTFEYALKYGADNVRGGGYCQAKPNWPELITQNERII